MGSSRTEELRDLLSLERAALLAGDFSRIEDIAQRKAEVARELEQGAELPQLGALRGCLRRNQMLLEASLKGISAARARLVEIRNVAAGFDTYGSDGGKSELVRRTSTLERRA